MPRARWLVLGALSAVVLVGGFVNERGPFDAHPGLAYEQFLEAFDAGRISRIVQWRDQLEVTRDDRLLSVVVPAGRDLASDLAQARRIGEWSFTAIPDSWVGQSTPVVPLVILSAAIFVWTTALARNRRAVISARSTSSGLVTG